MSLIEVQGLVKDFSIQSGEKIEVLKGIDFTANAGEFIAIMGPSGSGKSTFLNILSSIEAATTGTVIIDDNNLSKASETDLVNTRRHSSSIIFQDFNLLTYLTSLENIMFPMLISGKSESEARKKAFELLHRVHLEGYEEHPPDDLSGGQKQRVAIARALANDPKIILADEPTGNLDSKTGESILLLFEELVQQGITVIMVTHNIQQAKRAKRILVLRDGTLHKEEEVLEDI